MSIVEGWRRRRGKEEVSGCPAGVVTGAQR